MENGQSSKKNDKKSEKNSKKSVQGVKNPFKDGVKETVKETLSKESRYFESASGIADRLYRSMQRSFTGQLLTSAKSEAASGSGMILGLIKSLNIHRRAVVPARKFFNRQFSESAVLNLFSRLLSYLLSLPAKLYGILSISFGMYTAVIWLIMRYAFGTSGIGYTNLVCGIVLTLLSLFPLFTKGSIADAITSSRILSFILFDLLGAKKDTFEDIEAKPGKSYLAFLFGMLLSLATIKISCIYLALAAPAITLAILIIRRPTAGIVSILLTTPLLQNGKITTALILYTSACLVFKLISGKRILKVKATDLFVFILALMVLGAGQLSVSDQSASFSLSFICFILGYFLTTTLVTTRDSYERCRRAILLSSAISSSYGTIGLLLAEHGLNTGSLAFFSDSSYSAAAACFVMMTLPIVISFLLTAKSSETRFGAALSLCLGIAYLVMKLSGSAIIGLILGLHLFLLLSDRKAFAVSVGLFCIIGLVLHSFSDMLPDGAAELIGRFSLKNSLSSGSISGLTELVKSCLASGVGFGPDAFTTAYRELTTGAVSDIGSASNMFVQMTVEMGISSVIVFAAILILSLRETLYFMKNRSPGKTGKNAVIFSAACLGGVFAAVIFGSTELVWQSSVIMPVFWILLGLSCSIVRTAGHEEPKLIIDGPFAELYYPR